MATTSATANIILSDTQVRLVEYAEAVGTLSHLVDDSCGVRKGDNIGLAIILRMLSESLNEITDEFVELNKENLEKYKRREA